jgi:hypothetical protein
MTTHATTKDETVNRYASFYWGTHLKNKKGYFI